MSSRLTCFLLLATLAGPLACSARGGGGGTGPIVTDDTPATGDDTPVGGDDTPVVSPDAPSTCASPRQMCGATCTSVQSDVANCGSCGNRCASGQSCSGGSCTGGTTTCTSPQQRCGDVCINVQSDATNCGSCGNRCASGQSCSNGACTGGTTTCASPRVMCGTTCTDVQSDATNCGLCGLRCASGQTCSGGNCTGGTTTCTAPQRLCSGRCTDVTFDQDNCGACGVACASGQVCSSGACACPAGTESCAGVCADLTLDPGNCGSCGVACAQGQSCEQSVCTCPPGATLCNGVCADITSSVSDCGTCGHSCAAGQVCGGGLCLTAVSAWPTLGGNMRRSGENAAEIEGPPKANGWAVGLSPQAMSPAMVGEGRAYVTFGGFNGGGNGKLVALSVADGSALWSHDFGEVVGVGQPTLDGGRLYVQNGQSIDLKKGAAVSVFDAASGALIWSSPLGAQWEQYWSPAVVAGRVFMDGGVYGGLYGFDAASGSQLFFNDKLEQYDEWSPAVHNGTVYSFVAGSLRAHDPASGQVQWVTDPGWNWEGWSMTTAPAFNDTHAFVIAPPSVHAIKVATHAIVWSISANCKGTPAVAGGVVFALCGGQLSARDVANGNELWSFGGDGALSYPPIIAAGHVYVASKGNVYAVSIASHAQAWSAPVGGWLSIAAGRLFVARPNGTLTTFVLVNGP